MARTKIVTYSPERFRTQYIRPARALDTMLKRDYTKFFLARVQELLRLISLPVPPVRTTNHTMIYLTEGEATITVGSEYYRISRHDCLFVPAGQVYSFDKHDKNKGYICNFREDFVVGKFGTTKLLNDFEFLRVWGNPRVRLDVRASKYVRSIFDRLLQAYSSSGLDNLDILQSYFISLLCEVNCCYQPLAMSKNAIALGTTNKFKELVFKNFRSQQLVSQYAAMLNISPNHLNKVVKSVSGKTPTKWIDEAIVLEAKVLLYQSALSISEIAAEIGVLDQSYFSRLFKKYEGVSPMQFRQRIEKSKK